jgi:hypothetical protein
MIVVGGVIPPQDYALVTGEGHQVAVLAVDPSSGAAAGAFSATRPGWRS